MFLRLPLSTLLLSAVFTGKAAAASQQKCAFEVDQFSFDLCPLLQDAKEVKITLEEDTPPTHTTKIYRLNLGGTSLKSDKTLPRELQCPDDTAGCLTVSNTRPSHPSEPERILQVIPVARDSQPTASLWEKSTEQHKPLVLLYEGGSYGGATHKTAFVMRCRPESQNTQPEYSWTFNNTHVFNWDSPHACHKALAPADEPTTQVATTVLAPTGTAPAQETEAPSPPDVPSDDLKDDPDRAQAPRRVLLPIVLTVMGVTFLLLGVNFVIKRRESILASPHLHHLNFNFDKLKPRGLKSQKRRRKNQFRPPPNRLLEWASQSYPVGLEDDGEDWEEVPLAPHPDLPGRSRSSYAKGYGSTEFV